MTVETRTEAADGSRLAVPAVGRAAQVLRALGDSERPLTFGQLAAVVDLPRSSLHNLCCSLAASGFVEQDEHGRFQIGLWLVDLARNRLAGMDLTSSFRLAAAAGAPRLETLVLAVPSWPDVMYLAVENGAHPVGVRYVIGMRLPAAFTATGKAILATLPEDRVRELLGPVARGRGVAGGDKMVDDLLGELAMVRQRGGVSVDDEETAVGMVCVGAPVFAGATAFARGANGAESASPAGGSAGSPADRGAAGGAVAAVAFSMVKAGSDRLADYASLVLDLAARVGERL